MGFIKSSFSYTALMLVMAFSLSAQAEEKPTKVDSPPAAEVVKMIQAGGYVLYFRHGKTDRSQSDQNHQDLSDCATQRNLSDAGREQAKTISKVFTTNNIPVGDVLSSPYCRAKDTAKIAFGDYKVSEHLFYLSGAKPEDKADITEGVKMLLGKAPVAGKNSILISHTSNLKEAAKVWPRDPAVAVVFKPMGDTFEVVGKIEPGEWEQLVK